MGAKGVTTGSALEVVEHLIIQLAAQTCSGDPACRTTDQSTKHCSSDAADGDPYRTTYCTNQSTSFGATPGASRTTRCSGYGARGAS